MAGHDAPANDLEREPVEPGEAPEAADVPAAGVPDDAESAESLRDRWLRAEADLQNFRRRARRDAEEARRSAEEAALLEIVSFLDDLERALEAAAEGGAAPAWAEGVRLVAGRMHDYLARSGVEPIDPLGEPFDPRFHEAILQVDPPEGAEPGSVVNVVRKGYRRQGRALRAARVVVARDGDHGSD